MVAIKSIFRNTILNPALEVYNLGAVGADGSKVCPLYGQVVANLNLLDRRAVGLKTNLPTRTNGGIYWRGLTVPLKTDR
jgi:hypothetical protein